MSAALPDNNPKTIAPSTERILLGIDPGTQITGYGILKQDAQGLKLMAIGVVRLDKPGWDHPQKLHQLYRSITRLLEAYLPDELAIEAPFYSKNVQSMLKLGRAQGVVMAAALARDIPIAEYAPKRIKQSVTGNGNASKHQVAEMLKHLLPELRAHEDLLPDATDALAVAFTHLHQLTPLGRLGNTVTKTTRKSASYSSWGDFLAQNPDRVG
jgi:crossover junction endodeoxyribonuclease RuvC